MNALLTSLMSWHHLPSGSAVYTGDIMTGLMIAGSGIGLMTSLFIRETGRSRSGDRVELDSRAGSEDLADR